MMCLINRYKSLAVARDDGRYVTRDDLINLGLKAFGCRCVSRSLIGGSHFQKI